MEGEGWVRLKQARMRFQFAPNCGHLEFDEEASKSLAMKQGYELLFAGMTKVS